MLISEHSTFPCEAPLPLQIAGPVEPSLCRLVFYILSSHCPRQLSATPSSFVWCSSIRSVALSLVVFPRKRHGRIFDSSTRSVSFCHLSYYRIPLFARTQTHFPVDPF